MGLDGWCFGDERMKSKIPRANHPVQRLSFSVNHGYVHLQLSCKQLFSNADRQ